MIGRISMRIDDNLISYLEDLSYLTLSDDEKSRLKADMEKILDDISHLGELNTEGVGECSHPITRAGSGNINAFRENADHPSFDRELILKNAPVHNDEAFIAPKTID